MVALNNLRTRLKAVENIKQITTSMEMVASARLRKAQDLAKEAQFYVAKMRGLLERLEDASTDYKHPLFEQRDVKRIGLVVVASDRGLCGAYNTRVLTAADRFLKPGVELILLGRKAVQHYQHQDWPISDKWVGWSGKAGFDEMEAFAQSLIVAFLSRYFDEIWVAYTQFHTLMNREVVVERFLPVAMPRTHKVHSSLNYIFEPSLEEIYDKILPRYCTLQIETILHQAYASELAARIFSMKAASQNAEEMMEQLTLERNKVRQGNITRELLETTTTHID